MSVKIIAPIKQGRPKQLARARAAARFSMWFLLFVIVGIALPPLLLVLVPVFVMAERRRRRVRRAQAALPKTRDEQIEERMKTARSYTVWG